MVSGTVRHHEMKIWHGLAASRHPKPLQVAKPRPSVIGTFVPQVHDHLLLSGLVIMLDVACNDMQHVQFFPKRAAYNCHVCKTGKAHYVNVWIWFLFWMEGNQGNAIYANLSANSFNAFTGSPRLIGNNPPFCTPKLIKKWVLLCVNIISNY